jgi:hypothetical protein
LRDGADQWRKRLARTAPGCEEVDNDKAWSRILENILEFEIIFDIQWRLGGK